MDEVTYLAKRLVYENNLNYTTHIRQWCVDTYREKNQRKRGDFFMGGFAYLLALFLAFTPDKEAFEWVQLVMWTAFSIIFLWAAFNGRGRIKYWDQAVKDETIRVEEMQDKIALLDLEYRME